MSESNADSICSIGLFTLLGLLFAGLKLTGHITWSWFYVILPFWVIILAAIGIILILVIFYGVTLFDEMVDGYFRK